MVSILCYESVGLISEGTNDLISYVRDVGIHFGNKKVLNSLLRLTLCIHLKSLEALPKSSFLNSSWLKDILRGLDQIFE